VVVDPFAGRSDPGHRVRLRVRADIASWCESLLELLPPPGARGDLPATRGAGFPLADLQRANARIEHAIEEAIEAGGTLSEPFVARWLTRHIPPDHALVLSSSLPIRDVDAYGATDGPPVVVAANRGASGIDGILATTAGYAIGSERPLTAVVGDLAFLHDLNSLLLLTEVRRTVVVVLINNRGGGIFSFLPIAGHPAVFSPWFDTPHDVDLGRAASAFGIPCARADERGPFSEAYRSALARSGASVIEVASDRRSNAEEHARIEAAISAALKRRPA
jgi:2-succinyl-5-enolpyruvyl-6-hydroxy-3-cyclohexene-1-carboxylate synthase